MVSSVRSVLRNGASGTLTCGTEGIAFWTDDGLSFRWTYEQVVSITIGPGGTTETGGGIPEKFFGPLGLGYSRFLNKVTTRTVVHSLISLVMRDGSVRFRAAVPQQKLELDLAPALERLAARG